MIFALSVLVLAQERVELAEPRASYLISRPAGYSERTSWPAILDLGRVSSPAKEPGAFVLSPQRRDDRALALACLLDAKTRYRIDPDRVIVRGGPLALSIASERGGLFAGVALAGDVPVEPAPKAPPTVLFLARGEKAGAACVAALMIMKRSGVDAQVREATDEPGAILAALGGRIPPEDNPLGRADALERSGRTLDASLILAGCLERAELEPGARTRLRSLEGKAIIELAKVEIAMADRKYKDAVLRCREAARQFAWLPQGERIRRRLRELESRPEVKKALETPD